MSFKENTVISYCHNLTHQLSYELSLVDNDEKNILIGALKRIEENVCVRFRPRTTEADYIEFQNEFYEGFIIANLPYRLSSQQTPEIVSAAIRP